MAKPIPQKARKTIKQTVYEQEELYRRATEARYRMARKGYDAQDGETREAIDTIRDRLTSIATGYIRVFPNGKTGTSIAVKVSQELVDQNILYMAMEIIKDLAFMDVRVANFEFPKAYCAECGVKLTPTKARKVKV